MTRIATSAILLTTLLWTVPPSPAFGDAVREAFDSAFAGRMRRVRGTADRADDLALARDMLQAADQASDQPAMVELLCENARDLALRGDEGRAVAIRAMETLAERVPAKRLKALEEIVAIEQRLFAATPAARREPAARRLVAALRRAGEAAAGRDAADAAAGYYRRATAIARRTRGMDAEALERRLDYMLAREAALKRARTLIARIHLEPENADLRRQLVRVYLVDLDDPAAASRYAVDGTDEKTAARLALVAARIETLSPPSLLDLGNWYLELADQADPPAQPALLERAAAFYGRFLEVHKSEDLRKTRARLGLRRARYDLARLGFRTGEDWVDLLGLIQPRRDAADGRWQMKKGRLLIRDEGRARLALPVRPRGSYELDIRFTRARGDRDVVVMLPVAERAVSLVMSGWGNEITGLHTIAGQGGDRNPSTVKRGGFENKVEHRLRITVKVEKDKAAIRVLLDEKKLIDWSGPVESLDAPHWGLAARRRPGLGVLDVTVAFHQVRIRMLDGKLERVKRDP
jgi:hypothetical protein